MIDRTVTTVIDAERCTGCGDEQVHAVIALGYPDETYFRPAGRKGYVQRYFALPLSSGGGARG